MTQEEFVRFISAEYGHPIYKTREILKDMLDGMCLAFEEGNTEIQFLGYGTLSAKLRTARIGRNASTGQPIEIPPKHVPHFKPGIRLNDAIRKGFDMPRKKRGARHT